MYFLITPVVLRRLLVVEHIDLFKKMFERRERSKSCKGMLMRMCNNQTNNRWRVLSRWLRQLTINCCTSFMSSYNKRVIERSRERPHTHVRKCHKTTNTKAVYLTRVRWWLWNEYKYFIIERQEKEHHSGRSSGSTNQRHHHHLTQFNANTNTNSNALVPPL